MSVFLYNNIDDNNDDDDGEDHEDDNNWGNEEIIRSSFNWYSKVMIFIILPLMWTRIQWEPGW